MSSNIQIEESIEIDAPLAVVWDIVSRPGRYAEWVSNTDAVNRVYPPTDEEREEDTSQEELEAVDGMTYEERNKVFNRWRETTQWRIVEIESERRIVHECTDLPMANAMRVTFSLEPAEEGDGVKYTHGWDLDSKLGVAAKAFTPLVQRDIKATLENLKSLAERETKEIKQAAPKASEGEDEGDG